MSYGIPDHPIIRNCERTGYPDGKAPPIYYCPICGEEADELYIDKNDYICGCENCLELKRIDDLPCPATFESR